MNNCRFCVSRRASSELWNEPLLESDSFTVLPSLGSLVEGWLLIVPKQHAICLGATDSTLADEIQKLKVQVSLLLEARYGSACAFEHGPSAPNRAVGCSVDHAHLHMLPLDFDLSVASAPFMPKDTKWTWGDYHECRDAFLAGQDYLYIEQPIGRGLIAKGHNFGSQILRKAIASTLGIPCQYNWRDYPQLDVVKRTIRAFARAA